MASILALVNRLLPFATPGTPLIQDLIHLVVLCALLYFAPQIQQRFQNATNGERMQNGLNGDAQPEIIGHLHGQGGTEDGMLNQPNGGGERRNDDAHDFHDEQMHAGPAMAPNQADGDDPAQQREAAMLENLRQRNVGAKKAKSLARKDQRRAYHEFMRSQGDAQRARDAQGAAERDAALATEHERRKAAERALEDRKANERESKRVQDEAQREKLARRIEFVLGVVREELDARKACDLFKVAQVAGEEVDVEWIEKVLRSSGLLGRKGDAITMTTGMGWAVRVTAADMASLYDSVLSQGLDASGGRIGNEHLGVVLEELIQV